MGVTYLFRIIHFSRNDIFVAVLFIFIFLIIPASLSSGATILHQFKTENPDKQLENILYLTAGVTLTKAGFSSTRKENGSDYILLAEYTPEESGVKVRYALSKTDKKDLILGEVDFILSLDFDFEKQITNAVTELLQIADIDPSSSTDAEISEIIQDNSHTNSHDDMNHHNNNNKNPADTDINNGQTDKKITSVRFDSSISTSMVMLFGEITQYLHYGAAGLIKAGVIWSPGPFSIALDGQLSLIRMFNDTQVAGGPLYFTLAGINLQFGTDGKSSYMASAGLSGGVALITIADSDETLTKSVPYADTGIHMSVLMGKHLSLGGHICFLMIFDTDLLIMGVTPSITLGIKV